MTRPPPPTEALDEQERELSRIVRALPGGEPPAALDARILKAAANAAASSRRPGARWLASAGALWGIGGAAAAVLALGVSWQMMYGVSRTAQPAPTAVPASAPEDDEGSVAVELKEPSSPAVGASNTVAPAAPPAPPPAPLARSLPRPQVRGRAPPAATASTPRAAPEPFSDRQLDEQVATRAETMAGAEPAAPALAAGQAADSASPAQAASGVAAKAGSNVGRERSAVTAAAPAPAAQSSGSLNSAANSPASASARSMKPATWLARVRELRDQQRLPEARASLREFRRRYPDFVIPSDLAPLLRE
jgi:hypothetical protein